MGIDPAGGSAALDAEPEGELVGELLVACVEGAELADAVAAAVVPDELQAATDTVPSPTIPARETAWRRVSGSRAIRASFVVAERHTVCRPPVPDL